MKYEIKIPKEEAREQFLVPEPCPFCGGQNIVIGIDERKDETAACVVCVKCGAQIVDFFESLETIKNCIRKWNCRADNTLMNAGGNT